MKRSTLALVVALVLGGALAPLSAVAGGWAVVELAKPAPTAIVAGTPVTIAFRVLQHGRPEGALEGMRPVVTLMHRESKARTSISAVATAKDPALYEATLTLKETGSYKWNIAADPFPATAMPTLHVYATAAEAKVAAPEATTSGPVRAVKILEGSYAPSRLEIAPGTTVEWTNASVLPHQVVWSDVSLDDSAIVEPDGTFRVTFDEPGIYIYYCGPHPYMTGTIVVTDSAS